MTTDELDHSRSIPDRWLEAIFDQMGASILGYLRTMLHDHHRAEDATQNVFMRLCRIPANKRGDIRNLRALVFTIAYRECLRELGRLRSRREIFPGEYRVFDRAGDSVDPTQAMCIEEALLSLPGEQREVVYLKIYSGLTLAEIADLLNVGVNTAASRYRYAMEKMRAVLGADHE